MTSKFINFCGWEGSYGQFEIDSYEDLMGSDPYVGILVIHEGNWINPLNNKFAWSQCEYYEQAQQYFGVGLDFVQKIYVEEGNYTSFYSSPENYLFINLWFQQRGKNFSSKYME